MATSKDYSYDDDDDVQISRKFQENVVKYVKYDDLIKKKKEEIKLLNAELKPCEEYILKYLDKCDDKTVHITGGKLKKDRRESKQSIKQEHIKETLLEKIKDPQMVEDIMRSVDDKRETKETFNIKRTKVAGKIKAIDKKNKNSTK